MTTRLCHTLWLMLALGVSPALVSSLSAQPPGPSAAPEKLPPLPPLKSPVDLFRNLLAMSPAERDRELASRPPKISKRILAKLQEYAAMKPDERELRLRMTELRWYFLALLEMTPAEREARLAAVPETERQPLTERLQQWDRLPAAEQKEILKYEATMEQFVDQGLNGRAVATNILASVPSPVRAESLQNLDNFLNIPLEKRRQMFDSFQRFFELSDAEKQKAVGVLPDTQRQQMYALLHSFGNLPKEERDEFLKSFSKFSSMTGAERIEFKQNAERWQELTPAERAGWRDLVNRLPPAPPLPPGLASPPMPPHPRPAAAPSVATNSSP